MRRSTARLVALAGLVCAVLSSLGAVASAPAQASPERPAASHVVVVGVAGLRWTDVSADRTPTLARIVRQGSVGTLSVRSAPSVTCPGEGWLTLGAGTYAAVEDPSGTDVSRGCAPRKPPPVHQHGAGGEVVTMPLLKRVNEELRFGAEPGVLGETVRCAAASGRGAALAVADPRGRLDRYVPTLPDDPAPLLGRCPLAAVDLGTLPAGGPSRDRALRDFDAALARVDGARPGNSVLIVVGLAETDARQPRLHVAAITGDGFRGGWLRSPSTRRVPYVQLSDVAPTAMELLGQDVPDAMAGRPLTGGGAGRPDGLDATVRALADTDTAAVAQRDVLGVFFAGLGVVTLAVYAGLTWLLRRRRRGRDVPPATLRRFGVAALALAAVPGCTFIANLVPWWRARWPVLALAGVVLAAVAVTVAIGYAGPWRRRITGPVAAVSAITVLVSAVDGLTGTSLQINSLLGYNPLVAGRFTGFGNIAFAAFGAAVMLLTALLAYGRRRALALGVVAAMAVPMIVIDGGPDWGADFGGVLTFVPAFAILALLVARARINVGRLLVACGAGVLVVATIGVLDYLRPPESRSHFGRFVASVLDGSAGTTVYRKILTSIDLLFIGPHTLVAMALAVWLAVLVFRPVPTLGEVYREVPALRVALIAVVVLSVLGFATNDSGVAIPVVAGMVAIPVVFAICARVIAGFPAAPAQVAASRPTSRDTPVREVTGPTKVLP